MGCLPRCGQWKWHDFKEASAIFIKRQIGKTVVLEIPAFSETGLVQHGFSTRLGGVSQEPFGSLDLGIYNEDDLSAIQANRLAFAETVGVPAAQIVCCHQVHGTKVAAVGSRDGGRGFLDGKTAIVDTDGLMTNEPGVGLWACFADCTPLFFLDPVKRVIAVSHAGWRGTVARMGPVTVKRMQEVYGCAPQDILAGIGPSIGACHYEVDAPVIAKVQQAFDFWPQVLHFTGPDRARLDLWEANRLALLEAGLIGEHITVSGWCTYCFADYFYSYRRDNGRTGRMAALMSLQ